MADEILLPCPCCGGNARYTRVNTQADVNFGGEYVYCAVCEMSTALVFPLMGDVRRELAERWNRRASANRIAQLEADLENSRLNHIDANTRNMNAHDDLEKVKAERDAAFKRGVDLAITTCEQMTKEIVCPQECVEAIRAAAEQEGK